MRVTTSMYYRNLYAENNKVANQLFDVNKQIASGQKIQYAYENTDIFIQTMRLDDEIATLEQVKKSSNSGLQFSTNTDTTMNDMTTTLDAIKVKLIEAANSGVSSPAKREAIADELAGLRSHMIKISNTSINGQYLFSGTAVTTKPINDDGTYNGNDADMLAFFGSNAEQKYNISGAELFLGEENTIDRKITTNIALIVNSSGFIADGSNTLEDITDSTNPQFFYIRGTNHDGTSFKNQFNLPSSSTIDDLLQSIKNEFAPNSVDVMLDQSGQIVVTDKMSGSSKLDFHLVAGDNVNDIDALVPSIEFMKSGLNSSAVATGSESAIYDRTFFTHDGASLESNVSQVLKSDNTFAIDSTKINDVFASLTSTLHVEGKRLDGSIFNIDIDFGTPAAVSGDYNYNVADGNGTDTDGVDMTYRQLMDVINMAINNQTPADNDAGYRSAVSNANFNSSVTLSHDGKITFEDLNNSPTSADISIYDTNSDDFTNTNGAMATFNTNNALEIRDPKTNFFAILDEAIQAVRVGRFGADGNASDPRNSGIQNTIQKIDDLANHIGRQHAKAGVQSLSLQSAIERSDTLILSSMTLRSETLDTDIAEASLRLQQLTLNFQAMLSTVGKVSQLSLVNYL